MGVGSNSLGYANYKIDSVIEKKLSWDLCQQLIVMKNMILLVN